MQEEEEEEEQQTDEAILSQKLSLLSTKNEDETISSMTNKRQRQLRTSASSDVNTKKIKMPNTSTVDDNATEKGQIPKYLLTTNKLFVNMTKKLIKTKSSITLNDVQQVAIIMHQIGALRIKKQTAIVYLQSVTGELKEQEYDFSGVDRRVWPIQVKSLMLTHHKSTKTTTTNATKAAMDGENVQRVCENLLHQQLQEMNRQIEHLQKQFDEKKNSLIGFTSTMEDTIQNYVQQYEIKPLKIKNDFKIAMIKYSYDAEILQRQYLEEKPNEYQVKQKNKCSLKIV